MNKLFSFAGAKDLAKQSNIALLLEFRRLDKQIAEHIDHSDNLNADFTLAVLMARSKSILRELNK